SMRALIFRKKRSFLTFLLSLSCQGMCHDAVEARLSELEEKIDQVYTETVYGQCGLSLSSAFPDLIDNNSWSFSSSLLVWQLFENKTTYAIVDNTSAFTGSVHEGFSTRNEFDWAVGYRIGIGYNFFYNPRSCSNWDVQFQYTYFHTHESDRAASNSDFPVDFGVISVAFPSAISGSVEYALAIQKWRVKFLTFDLDIGDHLFFTHNLSFRPFCGLKGALIFQHVNAQFLNALSSPLDQRLAHNDFRGIGLTTGADAYYHFNSNWSLFNSFTSSLLFGKFHIKSLLNNNDPARVGLILNFSNLIHNTTRVLPQIQNIFGLSWEKDILGDSTHITFRVGYELQYWWGQNQFNHFLASVPYLYSQNNGDLSIQGVNIDLKIDF
ncbi:MAG TPA: Lpg1974 family pore-forming outer membrane protein, partial [Gammaproteobacteria bacterium]|nr:Lpg1974 family pore-forming outer membrane protein [Gammaproteobacteria bacterium]